MAKFINLLCSNCIHVMSVYYIRHLYIHIMFKKCQKHVKIISIKDQKQNKIFCEDENIQFNFIVTKIKIGYIYRDEKLI